MAIPVVRSIGQLAWGSGAISLPFPAGYAVNDILVMIIASAHGETVNATGWSHAPDSPCMSAAGGVQLNILWRRATGTDVALTNDSGDHQIGRMIAVSGGAAAGTPWDVTAQGFTGTGVAVTIPGDTTTAVDALCLVAACFQMGVDRDGFVTGWTNADLANITELFDNSKFIGRGGTVAAITGEKAAIGAVGDTTATKAAEGAYVGWFGALLAGSATGAAVDLDEAFTPETPVSAPTEYVNAGFGISTWEFDSPEPDEEDRDPISWYLAWQMMDNGSESGNKVLTAIRPTGKLTDAVVQIHAASPGEEIEIDDIENGTNERAEIPLVDTLSVTRYEREKVKVKNLSIWTIRISGEWNGTEIRDQIHELILEGRPHGVQK